MLKLFMLKVRLHGDSCGKYYHDSLIVQFRREVVLMIVNMTDIASCDRYFNI